MQTENTTNYIIEHFETELSEWTLKEYVHMIMLLNGLYSPTQTNNKLILTNFKYIHDQNLNILKDDDL